jgi:DNA-binding winged helix-turn-helix (wHTH) protein
LDTHIKNLRRKIETDPAQPQYIETVFGVGYRMPAEDSPSSTPRRGTLEASCPPAEGDAAP